MTRVRATALLSALALSVLAPGAARAQQSVFNAAGFGLPTDVSTMRGRALGDAGLGLDGETFSLENPAGLARFRKAGFYLSLLGQNTRIEAPDASATFKDVIFPSAQVVIPWNRVALAIGYAQYLDFDAGFDSAIEFEGDSIPVSLERVGGVSVLSTGVGWTVNERTRVGASMDVYVGSRRTVREVGVGDVSSGALATNDTLSRNFRGFGATLGIERTFRGRGRVSAAWHVRPTLTSRITAAPTGGLIDLETKVELPDEWVVGGAVLLAPRLTATVAARGAAWGGFHGLQVEPGTTADMLELGGGLEWRPEGRRLLLFGEDAPLRVGLRWRRLPLELNGSPVKEWAASVGYGRTFQGRSGFDVVLEAGRRGSVDANGLGERFLRLGVAMQALEPWKRVD